MLTQIPHSQRYSQQTLSQSPHKLRLQYQRHMDEINLMLRSLITAGKLKRMQLMSINNKAMFNRGKVKRCEWMAQRKFVSPHFLPDLRNMSLDYRHKKGKQEEGTAGKANFSGITHRKSVKTTRSEDELLDELVEREIMRIKQQKLVQIKNKQEIIREACRSIEKKMQECSRKGSKQLQVSVDLAQNAAFSNQMHEYKRIRTEHRRSVTEAIYCDEIRELSKKQQAFLKSKKQERKRFLRKLNNFNLPK